MHILRINTSDNSKIVIKSPNVQLGITRTHAEVGHKNIIIFSYKNHLDRFCIKGKKSYKKIYIITLCIFGTGARHNITHNISKN
jgi:hypothetical protein